jgi:hypothetical protein|tara:strand:+ start:62 stop:349 length:288 start_codon:yes stop_codon:yes gene_type:complete
MELICESYYWENTSIYKTIKSYCSQGFFTDIKRAEPSINIFGTREQIDKALDDYIAMTDLGNDIEVYDFEDKKMLKFYKKKYDEMNNNKALISTI